MEDQPVDVEIEKPHAHHHRRLGIPWYDLAMPVAALFVSLISIYIAWHHGQVMKELVHQNEKLVEANSLPYLQIYGSNGARGYASFSATNEGVGPARVVTAEVLVDRHDVQTLAQLLHACCGAGSQTGVASSTLLGRMIRPGDTVNFIEFPAGHADAVEAAAFDEARKKDRIEARLCYCSVFDDCWKISSKDPTPVAAPHCSPPAVSYRE
jgi:hypothetical protein